MNLMSVFYAYISAFKMDNCFSFSKKDLHAASSKTIVAKPTPYNIFCRWYDTNNLWSFYSAAMNKFIALFVNILNYPLFMTCG